MTEGEIKPTEEDRERMRDYIRGLPDDNRRLCCTWAMAQRILHVGTDYFGKRLNPQERRVWRRIIDESEVEITRLAIEGSGIELNDMFERLRIKNYRDIFEEEYYNLDSQA